MDTRQRLIEAAITVLEEEGTPGFSTRAVCDIAAVRAPALYHHFGSADGLLSAAIDAAFEQFLSSKHLREGTNTDPVEALRDGWDDLVHFVAERPRLYAAMVARMLSGASIAQANRVIETLATSIAAIDIAGRLRTTPDEALQIAWVAAQGASMLYAAPAVGAIGSLPDPTPAVLEGIRNRTLAAICSDVSGSEARAQTRDIR